jgi:F-type H+-transporting ATPase subunit delta
MEIDMKVVITSAIPLSSKQVGVLSKAIKKKYPRQKLEFERVVDPQILGGIKINLDSQSLDASLKAKLESLRVALYQNL